MEQPLNFFQSTDRIATSGQPGRAQFAEIAGLGYRAVVNLAMTNSDHAIADEGAIVTGLGMNYFHVPVPFDHPGKEHLRTFIGVMRALRGEKVWVHCVVNARVSAFMYHYLRWELGYDEERATSPILRGWRQQMAPVWQTFLEIKRIEIDDV